MPSFCSFCQQYPGDFVYIGGYTVNRIQGNNFDIVRVQHNYKCGVCGEITVDERTERDYKEGYIDLDAPSDNSTSLNSRQGRLIP